jgi:murein DD-endopeptidase MepM/ murein hydrolase activator NlpD
MAGFRGKDWAQRTWRKVKASSVPGKAQWHNLTGNLLKGKYWSSTKSLFVHNKRTILYGAGILVVVGSGIISGHYYVKAETIDVYHVSVAGEDIGIISNPQIYDTYKQLREEKLNAQYPNVHMELPAAGTAAIKFERVKLFQPEVNDKAVLAMLDDKIVPTAFGAELKVNGKLMGYVKDEATVTHILDSAKESITAKKQDQVVALSADSSASIVKSADPNAKTESVTVDKVDFVENIDVAKVAIQPQDVIDPEVMLKKLLTGDVQPYKYKIQKGDTLSQIAKKFNFTMDQIHQRNPWLVGDTIHEGEELDLTVLQPAVSIRTEETVVSDQVMAYTTDIVKDESLRTGTSKVIQAGKPGSKKMTFRLTRINGQVTDEELLHEEVLVEPVKEIVKKGTLVIKGEGTGKFAWPVLSARITSTFGMRWGAFHKGLDIIGNMNIMAADNGVVEVAGFRYDYGNYVVINHKNGYKTLYGHMSKLLTSVGATVQKGDKIGIMGETGDAYGVHLHFEVQQNGTAVNPLMFLNR